MKIVHVISSLTKGGGERIVVELANKAVENGDEVTILAAWQVNPDFLQNTIDSRVRLIFISKNKKSAYLKIVPWIIKNRSWLSRNDVLHCHLTFGAVFGSAVKLIMLNKKTVIIETNHAVGMPVPKFNRWMHSRLLLMRDGIVLMAKDTFWDNFVRTHPKLTIDLIPNGIALITFEKNEYIKQEFKKELGIPETCKYIIGTVSMLRPDRKPSLYIPLYKDIYNTVEDDAHFVLAGSGGELEKIKSLILEYNVPGLVHMPGLVKVAADTIRNFDVYVSVSVGNTTGISMIEAAMCKVPVVGIQLLKDYETTDKDWVWSHADLDQVAGRIIHLLNNPEERKKMAEKQYKYVVEHFTSDAMYSSYNSFYKKILKQRIN